MCVGHNIIRQRNGKQTGQHSPQPIPKTTGSKRNQTGQPIWVLLAVRTGVSAEAGRGRATVLPPEQCTRHERRTCAKGSGVFPVGPPVPLARGL